MHFAFEILMERFSGRVLDYALVIDTLPNYNGVPLDLHSEVSVLKYT